MEKEKRKTGLQQRIPKAVYVIVALALLLGVILGISMNQTPPVNHADA